MTTFCNSYSTFSINLFGVMRVQCSVPLWSRAGLKSSERSRAVSGSQKPIVERKTQKLSGALSRNVEVCASYCILCKIMEILKTAVTPKQ